MKRKLHFENQAKFHILFNQNYYDLETEVMELKQQYFWCCSQNRELLIDLACNIPLLFLHKIATREKV